MKVKYLSEAPVKCIRVDEETATDWCLADSMRDSLLEHMELLKKAQERIAQLEKLRISEIVVGDRMTAGESAEGTILSVSEWDKLIKNNEWYQVILRPVK